MRRTILALVAAAVVVVAVAGCGRIGFDPALPGDDAPGGGDGGTGGDGGDGGGGDIVDAPPATACDDAIPVELGVRLLIDTCAQAADRVDGCGPPGTQDVVLAFAVPATRAYQFRLHDPGTNNVSESLGIVDAACARVGTCAGITGTTLTGGQTVYFAAEASSGGCRMVEFLITD